MLYYNLPPKNNNNTNKLRIATDLIDIVMMIVAGASMPVAEFSSQLSVYYSYLDPAMT